MDNNYNKMFNNNKEGDDGTVNLTTTKNDSMLKQMEKEKEMLLPEKNVKVVVTNCTQLNVRKEPNLNSEVLIIADENDKFILEPYPNEDPSEDEWAFVQYKKDTYGYVMGAFIKEV